MPDWNAYVRERLHLQGVRPECEQNVIDDLAGQFEEAYRDAIASGLSDAEATTAAMAHVTDWRELARQIAKSRRLAAPVIDRLSIRAGDAAVEGRPRGWFLAELALTLRVAARLRRHPGYVAMSTFVLAVSVGINLLVFTVVNALWIRPLPFPDPERVVTILNELPHGSVDSPRFRIFEGGAAGQVETTEYNAGLRPQIEIGGQVPEILGVTSGYFRVTAEPGKSSAIVSNFVIRTENPEMVAGMVRRTIKGEVVRVATGREAVARDIGRQRLGAWFFSGFGLAALLLGVGGAFGLVAYLAESRRREFGIRLALGADMSHLLRRGLTAALAPVSTGVAAGLIIAGIVSQVFEAYLVGISALDAVAYLLVAVTMLGCTTIAALAAAWRLRRTNPSDALRAT